MLINHTAILELMISRPRDIVYFASEVRIRDSLPIPLGDVHGPGQVRPRDVPSPVANAPRLLGAWRSWQRHYPVRTIFAIGD